MAQLPATGSIGTTKVVSTELPGHTYVGDTSAGGAITQVYGDATSGYVYASQANAAQYDPGVVQPPVLAPLVGPPAPAASVPAGPTIQPPLLVNNAPYDPSVDGAHLSDSLLDLESSILSQFYQTQAQSDQPAQPSPIPMYIAIGLVAYYFLKRRA